VAGVEGPARWPDVVAALQWNFPNGAVYASGMIGQRFIDTGGGAVATANLSTATNRHDSDIIWGATLAGRYEMGRIEIGGIGGVGRGIGNKYFDGGATGLQNGVIIINNGPGMNVPGGATTPHDVDLRGAFVWGGIAYVQVKLTDTIRATAAYNYTKNNMASEVPGYYNAGATSSKSVLSGAVDYYWAAFGNILWNPVPQVTFGAEYGYQYASRYNSNDSHVHRLQLAAIYRF
jgi:hypothetical protein